MTKEEFIRDIEVFNTFGTKTRIESFHWSCSGRSGTTPKAFNEYWTSAQRQAHSLHEFSYRACFKPQLPEFFISRLTNRGDRVYDPFMGRGTTPIAAFLEHRRPLGNDINPLSVAIVAPRLNPPDLADIIERLDSLDLRHAVEHYPALNAFFH
ncbi:MAG: DNA methyltransferase, partial [Vicinamibacterales bacterium]